MELSEIRELTRIKLELGTVLFGMQKGYAYDKLREVEANMEDLIVREFTGGKVAMDEKGVVVNPLEG